MSASCKPGVQLFTGIDNGWPHSALPITQISCHLRKSASGRESVACKKRYSK